MTLAENRLQCYQQGHDALSRTDPAGFLCGDKRITLDRHGLRGDLDDLTLAVPLREHIHILSVHLHLASCSGFVSGRD